MLLSRTLVTQPMMTRVEIRVTQVFFSTDLLMKEPDDDSANQFGRNIHPLFSIVYYHTLKGLVLHSLKDVRLD